MIACVAVARVPQALSEALPQGAAHQTGETHEDVGVGEAEDVAKIKLQMINLATGTIRANETRRIRKGYFLFCL